MAFTTYSGLKDEINSRLARSDLTAAADTFIDFAEARLSRDLRLRACESTLNVTLSGGLAAIPSDYVQMKHVHISGTPVQPLEPKESTWIFDQYPDRTSQEKARFVAEDGGNFVFGPSGANGSVLGGQYYKKPTGLSDSNTTNEWTTEVPDALFYACLAEAANYIKDTNVEMLSEAKYQAIIDRINKSERKRTRRGSRIAIDPGVY